MLNTRVADKKTVDAAILDSDAGIVGHSDLKNKIYNIMTKPELPPKSFVFW
jgi:hypothetical protein